MKKHTSLKLRTLLTLCLVSTLFSACNTTAKPTQEAKTETEDDYVLVYAAGSRIPKKVKRGTVASGGNTDKNKDEIRTHQDMAREARFDPKTTGN